MTTIRTKCHTCGDVDVAVDAMSLYLDAQGENGTYRFPCPECASSVSKPASRRTAALLIAAGVPPAATEPDEPLEASRSLPYDDLSPDPLAPALTLDDVIAFHFLLEDDVALEEEMTLQR